MVNFIGERDEYLRKTSSLPCNREKNRDLELVFSESLIFYYELFSSLKIFNRKIDV